MNATMNYCEVHPGMDAKVRYQDYDGDHLGCYYCWVERPRAWRPPERGDVRRWPMSEQYKTEVLKALGSGVGLNLYQLSLRLSVGYDTVRHVCNSLVAEGLVVKTYDHSEIGRPMGRFSLVPR